MLAYSTVSQLGYMFLGVGVGAFTAGFFHVITHAFFKACLFLGAGSVIHAMHARIHDADASQDMRHMGGLRRYLPITFWTFAAACAAIVGFPLTSGFFSKDAILLSAFTSSVKVEHERIPLARGGTFDLFLWPSWGGELLYGLGLAGAVMTAFYMTRLFIGIFFGEFPRLEDREKWQPPAHEHGHDDHAHEQPGPGLKGPTPHESPWQMWVPLAILGGLSLVAGLLNAHLLDIHAFDHFLEPVFAKAAESVHKSEEIADAPFLVAAVAAFALGSGSAYWVYVTRQGEPARAFTERSPGLYALVRDKWRIDELYEETVIGAVDSLADIAKGFDKWVVDGIIARLTAFVVSAAGGMLRVLQTGKVQAYAFAMVVGLAGVGWFFFAPHAEARVTSDDEKGSYVVALAPGPGYAYRWDADGDGKWDDRERFSGKRELKFDLAVAEEKKVRFEVRNVFGQTTERTLSIARPKPDLSGADPQAQRLGGDQGGQPPKAAPPGGRAP